MGKFQQFLIFSGKLKRKKERKMKTVGAWLLLPDKRYGSQAFCNFSVRPTVGLHFFVLFFGICFWVVRPRFKWSLDNWVPIWRKNSAGLPHAFQNGTYTTSSREFLQNDTTLFPLMLMSTASLPYLGRLPFSSTSSAGGRPLGLSRWTSGWRCRRRTSPTASGTCARAIPRLNLAATPPP